MLHNITVDDPHHSWGNSSPMTISMVNVDDILLNHLKYSKVSFQMGATYSHTITKSTLVNYAKKLYSSLSMLSKYLKIARLRASRSSNLSPERLSLSFLNSQKSHGAIWGVSWKWYFVYTHIWKYLSYRQSFIRSSATNNQSQPF